MALKDDLTSEVKSIFQTDWKTRNGTVVPTDTRALSEQMH
jgi:hypothetical protein